MVGWFESVKQTVLNYYYYSLTQFILHSPTTSIKFGDRFKIM